MLDRLEIFRCRPDAAHARLGDRASNEACLTCETGRQDAVYLPGDGSVTLDLADVGGRFDLSWLGIETTTWHDAGTLAGGEIVRLTVPAAGARVAVLRHAD